MGKLQRLKRVWWLALIAIALFVPAGTAAWPQGWIFLIGFVGGLFATMGWLKRHDPELYHERMRRFGRQDGQPLWDKLFGLAMALVWYIWIAFMALDVERLRISAMPVWTAAAGIVLMPTGYFLAALALKANSFAVTAVRLQPERAQAVADTGPYAYLRHPMYSASVLIHIGTALLLGSAIGLAAVWLIAVMLAVRAVLEERMLCAGLPGYADYMARVRWRLVPALW